ncbi:hypothetical protein QBC35DRAFT_487719 [Podospora australis]|uniref:Uncharacterized protein n=1 Tax=Podospora australis TaxID=1536484 RepID=A0AAN6WZS5_9PEZI|nr:hypothetical protein QBC35DRAFT_487719 [Podospora australis]
MQAICTCIIFFCSRTPPTPLGRVHLFWGVLPSRLLASCIPSCQCHDRTGCTSTAPEEKGLAWAGRTLQFSSPRFYAFLKGSPHSGPIPNYDDIIPLLGRD